jgi:DNA-binding transcriptional LysR family regulator
MQHEHAKMQGALDGAVSLGAKVNMASPNQVSWDDLRVLLAVARQKSHGGAGRLLGVDPTTVGRRIAALEAALGARLFDRTPAGLVATQAGSTLAVHASNMESELLSAERAVRGADAELVGPVRITAGDGMVHYALVPALTELRRVHPGIAVEFRADTRSLDLSRREADVAVRFSRPKEASLVVRRIGSAAFGLYASRSYLDRAGPLRTLSDLGAHDFVGFDASLDDLPQVRWLRQTMGKPRWVVRATSTTAQVLACAEGQGIALLPTFVSAHEPRLVPVLASRRPPPRDVWIAVHRDMHKNARAAAVIDWIARAVAFAA